jgi:uncharacterized OB-fold protein
LEDLQDEPDDSIDDPDSSGEFETDRSENEDASETVPCPECGRLLYKEAQRCPHCASYVSLDDSGNRKSGWLVAGIILCLIIILIDWIAHA